MELTAGHVYKRMVKIGNVLEVDNKTAVCLKKTVFGQYFQIMLHIAGGFKIAHRGMDDYLSPLCLQAVTPRQRSRRSQGISCRFSQNSFLCIFATVHASGHHHRSIFAFCFTPFIVLHKHFYYSIRYEKKKI